MHKNSRVLCLFMSLLLSASALAQNAFIPGDLDIDKLEDYFDIYMYLSEDLVLAVTRSEYQLITLDLNSGHEAPWRMDWDPESLGWNTFGYWHMTVSPDEEWVVIARSLGIREDFEFYIPGREAVGLILCRPDGSDARGIALGQSPCGGEMPIYSFTSDSRLIVGNNIVCEFMTPDEYALTYYDESGPQLIEEYMDSLHYYNLETMAFESREYCTINQVYDLYPSLSTTFMKCPWSDIAIYSNVDGGGICYYFEFRSLTMDGPIIGYDVPDEYREDGYHYPVEWLTEDAVLFHLGNTLGVLHTDGTFIPLPDSVSDWSFEILDDSTYNFRRGCGEALEHGLIRWDEFEVLWSDSILQHIPEVVESLRGAPGGQ